MLYADMQAHWRALQACASGACSERIVSQKRTDSEPSFRWV